MQGEKHYWLGYGEASGSFGGRNKSKPVLSLALQSNILKKRDFEWSSTLKVAAVKRERSWDTNIADGVHAAGADWFRLFGVSTNTHRELPDVDSIFHRKKHGHVIQELFHLSLWYEARNSSQMVENGIHGLRGICRNWSISSELIFEVCHVLQSMEAPSQVPIRMRVFLHDVCCLRWRSLQRGVAMRLKWNLEREVGALS